MTTTRTFTRRLASAALAVGLLGGTAVATAAPAMATTWHKMTINGTSKVSCEGSRNAAVRALRAVSHSVKYTSCVYTGSDSLYVSTVYYR